MKPKIGLICLGVRDLQRSIAFYRDGLRFPTDSYVEGEAHVMFRLDGAWLSLFPRDLLAGDASVSPDGAGFPGFTIAHNVKSREEADEVFALAVSCGARAIKTPQEASWGGYSGYFADPDGFLWEVAFNPFTDLT